LSQGGAWTDPDFTTDWNDSLVWSSYPRGRLTAPAAGDTKTVWKRITDHYPNSALFGSDNIPDPAGVAQGALGDCYWLAAASAFAENPERFKAVWNTKAKNTGHIYSANFWIGGKQRPVTVDDNIIFSDYYGDGRYVSPKFSKLGAEGGFWGPIMEKMWAKMHGNFERIIAGDPREGFRALNGNPTTYHSTQSFLDAGNAAGAWALLETMDKAGDVISCGSRNGRNGIVLGHAYTILGVKKVTMKRAGVTAERKLVVMRNPWASEKYVGPFSDSDSCWRDAANRAAKAAAG
jgi:calpain-10